MAYCRIVGKPFTFPESSGCRQPVVGGVYILPSAGGNFLLTGLLETYGTAGLNMETRRRNIGTGLSKGGRNGVRPLSCFENLCGCRFVSAAFSAAEVSGVFVKLNPVLNFFIRRIGLKRIFRLMV